MATESVEAKKLKEGDQIHFPNSRHAQELTKVEKEDDGTNLILSSGIETRWMVAPSFIVQREVDNG